MARYLADLHEGLAIMGVDFNERFQEFFSECERVTFEAGDLYRMNSSYVNRFDGAVCLQTLSWLPGYQEPLENICGLNTNWIAMSLLGYEGKINFNIRVENYESLTPEGKFTQSHYNVYSIPMIKEFLMERGFCRFDYEEFVIDMDLEKPKNRDMGTYTVKTADQKRMQVSGALLMPWYFIFAGR